MSLGNSLKHQDDAEASPTQHVAVVRAILVVEDHPAHRQMTQAVLEALGHQVTTAVDGFAGVEAANATAFDVIVMDRNMPRCGGDEATVMIRSLPGPSRHAIIICHSTDPPVGEKAALYDDILQKPATSEAVQGLLGRLRARIQASI
ncbi:MAG: multi-sensor hybrid histidine kinase [Cyanobacteria bacterium RYN_339]|nr:multi-sensor hybrid histidine kinase [Cyanobacteria bacterium RYN_339]